MEAEYILSLDNLRAFCERNRITLSQYGGDCKKCKRHKECCYKSKEFYVDRLKHMELDDTKYPKMIRMVQNHNDLLYVVPAKAYEKAWGLFSSYLPCQFDSSEIIENLDRISDVYTLLTDEESKLAFLNVLMYRLTLQTDYVLRAYSSVPQYFISEFRGLDSDEVYVDCGAYIGDSLDDYCRYNQAPKKAYLFEPDPANAEKLHLAVLRYPNTEAVILKKGVYKTTGILHLVDGAKVCSRLSQEEQKGCVPIDVVSIDDSIMEHISFLKMDIEGSEKDAILGAAEHIRDTYPRLAICIYHMTSDLWEIPLMIKQMFPNYKHFEIHHHSTGFAETVLYVYP